jgi:Ca-activated chloride channel family protein
MLELGLLDEGTFAEFHLLRPEWLWVLLPTLVLWLVLRRRGSSARQWRRVMAAHLLEHLRIGAGRRLRFRPLHLVVAVLVLGSVGLAGPTWEREVSPFAEDTAPLVIALDVSRSMNAVDVQPTRLERAKQKARDLLDLRTGSRSALIAYAGSAHTVLPLCDDPTVFETFLAALETEVMPVRGKDPARALAVAEELLVDEPTPGSILFLTDGIATDQVPVFADHARRSQDEVLVLAVGTREGGPVRLGESGFQPDATGRRLVATLDIEGLETLEAEAGVFVAGVTVDDADVGRIQRRVQSHLREAQQQDQTARWKDEGYWLVVPVALLCLLWFRKGWTVRWGAVMLGLLVSSGCGPPGSDSLRFADLWLTADQQGRRLFERGEYDEATRRFVDPMWKGVAAYSSGEFERAAESFARLTTAEASFNLGNAYAMVGRYQEAVTAYEAAIAERPGWAEAIENRETVLALIPVEPDLPEEEQTSGDPSFDPDEIQFDEKGKKGKPGEVQVEQLTDQQLAEMWLRRLETSPADFLRQRFALEAAADSENRE